MGVSELAERRRVERFLAVDDQGILLRVTWRSTHGFLNLSLWRDGVCVETFHLSPSEAGKLVAFVATTLTAALPDPDRLRLRLADPAPVTGTRAASGIARSLAGARSRLAEALGRFGRRS